MDRSRLRSRRQIIHHVGSVQETVPEMNTGQNFLISEKQSSDIAVQNGSGSEDDTRSRKMRKPNSDFSVKEQEAVDGESDTEGSELGASVSAIFIGSVCVTVCDNHTGVPVVGFCHCHGVQGWRSGESTRLPPMWPGFDSRTRRHMWVEFVGSLLCTERFSPGTPVSPLLKNQHLT